MTASTTVTIAGMKKTAVRLFLFLFHIEFLSWCTELLFVFIYLFIVMPRKKVLGGSFRPVNPENALRGQVTLRLQVHLQMGASVKRNFYGLVVADCC